MPDPETVPRRLIDEGFSGGNLDAADELVADGLRRRQVRHRVAPPRLLRLPPRVADLVVDGERVWARNVGSGTNDGPFMGHPPTGRTTQIEVFDVVRVRDGKIVEHWGVPDRLGALLQLGLARPPAPAPA